MATQDHILPKAPVSPVAVTRLLSRHTRAELVGFVSVAIDLLDTLDGDPDAEPNGDDEPQEANGDTQDAAWIEWEGLHPGWKRGAMPPSPSNEDDEEDDPAEEDDDPGQNSEDELSSGANSYGWYPSGPGCPIADPDYGHDGS